MLCVSEQMRVSCEYCRLWSEYLWKWYHITNICENKVHQFFIGAILNRNNVLDAEYTANWLLQNDLTDVNPMNTVWVNSKFSEEALALIVQHVTTSNGIDPVIGPPF